MACRELRLPMMHEAGERSSRVVDCLSGDNHFAMSGCLSRSSDLASFAGLVHTLYGRVDYLINCEDAAVAVRGLHCSARARLSVLLEHAFVSGAVIVNMVSCSGRKMKRRWKEDVSRMEDGLARRDVRMNQVVIHPILFFSVSPMSGWLLPPVRPLCFCAGVKAGILTGSTLSSMKEGLSGGPVYVRKRPFLFSSPTWSFVLSAPGRCFWMPDTHAIFLYSVVTKSVC